MRRFANRCVLILGLWCCPSMVLSQGSTTGGIEGKTGDGSGHVVPEVLITAILGSTFRHAVSAKDGRYSMEDLSPGQWMVKAEPPGYQEQHEYITVEAGKVATADFVLELRA